MLGDDQGLLKILFDPETLKLLGVHIIGERAAEIVHTGQAVLTMGATIEYFRDTVFKLSDAGGSLPGGGVRWAEQTLHSVLWRAWTGRSPVTTRPFHRRA